ncbi:unnamed protein product [Caenorhabditis sp. 36 PRJEB53466]|nr:unnamed protein product [Caenorhabditis sp. 36 PRJEB53466]
MLGPAKRTARFSLPLPSPSARQDINMSLPAATPPPRTPSSQQKDSPASEDNPPPPGAAENNHPTGQSSEDTPPPPGAPTGQQQGSPPSEDMPPPPPDAQQDLPPSTAPVHLVQNAPSLPGPLQIPAPTLSAAPIVANGVKRRHVPKESHRTEPNAKKAKTKGIGSDQVYIVFCCPATGLVDCGSCARLSQGMRNQHDPRG